MGDMPSESPVRQLAGARTPIHDRVSAQVRRFALLWAAAALGVVAAIILARIASGAYEDQARQRATAVDRVQAAATGLLGTMQTEMNDRLVWEISQNPDQARTLGAESAATQAAVAHFAQTLRTARAAGAHTRDAQALTRAIDRGESALDTPDGPAAPPPAEVDARGTALTGRLAQTATDLAAAATAAHRSAAATAWKANMARLVATLVGLAVLLAGGARLLHKAWRLAIDADARRERQVRWSDQIEQILAWSSRAKEATTRSQLIGFAHMAPRDAIGAACLTIAEGGPLDRARRAVRSLAVEPGDGRSLSASIGWAVFPEDASDRPGLVQAADAALYRAKTAGRDRVFGAAGFRPSTTPSRRRPGP